MEEIILNEVLPEKYLKIGNMQKLKANANSVYKTKKAYLGNLEQVYTTIVRVKGFKSANVISVKSSKPISMDLWMDVSKALSRIRVGPKLKIGDIICKNILNTGVDIICTKELLD